MITIQYRTQLLTFVCILSDTLLYWFDLFYLHKLFVF